MADQDPPRDLTATELLSILRCVEDPDLHMSIVDLGLIYKVEMNDGKVDCDMTLTSPGCPYGPQLLSEVHHVLKNTHGVQDVNVELVWDPPWSVDFVSDEAKLEMGIDW